MNRFGKISLDLEILILDIEPITLILIVDVVITVKNDVLAEFKVGIFVQKVIGWLFVMSNWSVLIFIRFD